MERFTVEVLRDTVTTFRDAVLAHAAAINRLNVYPVPDGDTGTNMARTLEAVVAEMDGVAAEMGPTCDAISYGSLMGARGNSGVILSQIMRGIASTLKPTAAPTAETVADALEAAAKAAYQAVLKPIEGTILTVARESATAARQASDDGLSLRDVLHSARQAGRDTLERTPELLPVLKDAGVVDAGGAGFLLLLDAALHVVDGEPLPEPPEGDDTGPSAEALAAVAHRSSGVDGELDVSEQRYEVMYLCDLADERIEDLKQHWGQIGDSIVVVGGDGIWNCHVHTNDIGAAIEVALDLDGRPKNIRVTDLFEEMAAEHAVREAALHQGATTGVAGGHGEELPPVTTAVVAVSSGPGISELFRDLGVQAVVAGGQTLNPSTAELLAAVERLRADQVIVLPNNKNIIPVAEQLDGLTSRTVRVVPTKSMPEGLGALIAYDPEADAPSNTTAMRSAADAVRTGEITRAVRSTQTPAGAVAEGDWMGLVRGEGISAVGSEPLVAIVGLLEHIVDEESELVTVITGADATQELTAGVQNWLDTHRPGIEIEIHDGGQPLYPYLFGVE